MTLRPYRILIGCRGEPRLDFGCMAESSARAFDQYVDLAEVGERCEVIPVTSTPFAVTAKRQELECAALRAVG